MSSTRSACGKSDYYVISQPFLLFVGEERTKMVVPWGTQIRGKEVLQLHILMEPATIRRLPVASYTFYVWLRGLTFTWWGCCGLCFWYKPTELARSFFIVFLCLYLFYGPFDCISFFKVSGQLSAFSLCSFGLISTLLVLSTIYHHLFMYVSLSPDKNPLWLTGLKAPTN